MLYNGLCAVVDGALRRLPASSAAHARRDALLLGALREDVVALPGGRIVEHLSLTHQTGRLPGGFVPFVVPSPHVRIRSLVRAARRQRDAEAAWVLLGRALHLVADLACPAHTTRTVHLRDPFEGWVEVHGYELLDRAPLEPPAGPLGAITTALAARSGAHPADGTSSPWGRALAAWGLRTPLAADVVAAQAAELVPHAMATAAAVVLRFEEA